jgi:S1-C subfamily serine protease
MVTSFRAFFSLCCLAIALAACESGTNIDIESRNFNVQQTVVPAGDSVASTEQIARLVRRSGPSYVTIIVSKTASPDTVDKDNRRGVPVASGSGFVVDGSGYVMTAAHVAKRTGNVVSVRAANGRVYSGDVVALNAGNDMAIIRLRGFSGKPVTPADNQCLARGNFVYSLGRPHEQGDTARLGEFESQSFGQSVRYSGADAKFGYPDAMVLRLSTQKGESGGPLFDADGNLVGMVVSTLYDNTGKPLNIAHAVPSRTLAGFLCSSMQCSAKWRALASGAGDNCRS